MCCKYNYVSSEGPFAKVPGSPMTSTRWRYDAGMTCGLRAIAACPAIDSEFE